MGGCLDDAVARALGEAERGDLEIRGHVEHALVVSDGADHHRNQTLALLQPHTCQSELSRSI